MPDFDELFDGFQKRSKAISAFERDTSGPSDAERSSENSAESFLDIVGDLALRQRLKSTPYTEQGGTDLSTVSLKDYPEIDSN